MASMNDQRKFQIPLPNDSSGQGSNSAHDEFPPLPSLIQGGSSSMNSDKTNLSNNNGAGGSSEVPLPESSKQRKPVPVRGNRIPYVSMFKDNRKAKNVYKLDFVDPGNDMIIIGEEHVDSIEKTYGFCLLGYVISGKPPTASLIDLARRWGPNIQFQTHESGWIIFKFPSAEVRDRILEGGPYMVYGFHLFIKEMPTCFRFTEDDMNTIPSWVQIHGLPPDCWNVYVLSRIASVIGRPIHMDMLTHDRKRFKFARVLVEMDIHKPKLNEVNIQLPIGITPVTFVYEHEFKLCEFCKKPGHFVDSCYAKQKQHKGYDKDRKREHHSRGRSKSVGENKRRNRSKSVVQSMVANDIVVSSSPDCHETESSKRPPPGDSMCNEENQNIRLDKGKMVIEEEAPVINILDQGDPVTLENKSKHNEGMSKNQKKKEKKKNNKNGVSGSAGTNEQFKEFIGNIEDESSCDTEFKRGDTNQKQTERFVGNEEKGRHTKSASGS